MPSIGLNPREFSIKKNKGRDGPLYILRRHRLQFPKQIVFLSMKFDFVLANSEDLDKMLHNAAFHLGLLCLPKYLFRGLMSKSG